MADWKQAVSANASTVTIKNISDYTSVKSDASSPIDSFYIGRNELLSAVDPIYAKSNPSAPPLSIGRSNISN